MKFFGPMLMRACRAFAHSTGCQRATVSRKFCRSLAYPSLFVNCAYGLVCE